MPTKSFESSTMSRAPVVPGVQPVHADENEKHFARLNLLVKMHDEVDAGRDVVHIHEDGLLSEGLNQTVVQSTRRAYGVRPGDS